MLGLLGDIYSASNTLKRRLRGLLEDPAETVALGVERFAENQNQLLNLFSNAYPMKGYRTVLNTPEQIKQFRNDLVNESTNQLLGMIKTPFGRIPKTSKEIDSFADYFANRGKALGHNVSTNASNVSGSRYITFKPDDAPEIQVRISNHGDRYPNQLAGIGDRFSIDPESRNTFEMAKDWLKDNGVNLSKKTPKQPVYQSPFLDQRQAI